MGLKLVKATLIAVSVGTELNLGNSDGILEY